MFKFDFFLGDLVWQESSSIQILDAEISFGSKIESDIALDLGLRSNENGIIDQGQRIIEVEN